MTHNTTIVDPGTSIGGYWWTCTCGDEGGPHESYNQAWDATVDHERR